MSTNSETVEGAVLEVQQFQAHQGFRQDWWPAPTISAKEREPLASLDDISLAMRQFYQAPVRSAG